MAGGVGRAHPARASPLGRVATGSARLGDVTARDPSTDAQPAVKLLAVCTYNQTRSVMMAGLLAAHCREVGVPARILSAGMRASGRSPASDPAIRLLAGRGIDVRDHVSTRVDEPHVRHADLIVCAQHDQVVSISGAHPGSFRKTFTLPEIVRLGELVGPRRRTPWEDWLTGLGEHRFDPMQYLEVSRAVVGELADPTGMSPATWQLAFDEIDDLTRRLVELLR